MLQMLCTKTLSLGLLYMLVFQYITVYNMCVCVSAHNSV